MLEKAQSLVLRFFTIIRLFSCKQNCIRLMGPDPSHVFMPSRCPMSDWPRLPGSGKARDYMNNA